MAIASAEPIPAPIPAIEDSAVSTSPSEEGVPFLRQSVEFVVMLVLIILIFRTFAAEAYIVPTGSMAPTLLGNHREILCSNCEFRFTLGVDESGRAGTAVCPNCGQIGLDSLPVSESNGDRVLVQKFLYDVRRPRRWEVSVFSYPGDPSQAYVKRVIGLPGDSVQIEHGDILIDGEIARKSLAQQKAMRLPVFDNDFVPKDISRYPRWLFRRGDAGRQLESGWKAIETRFEHHATDERGGRFDWIDYHHWDPTRGRFSPVYDHNPYNGLDLRGENVVRDLMVEARIKPAADLKSFAVRIESGGDRFVIEIPTGDEEKLRVTRNGRSVVVSNPNLPDFSESDEGLLVEASAMDRRLTVAVGGNLLFDPIDYHESAGAYGPGSNPVGFGARGGGLVMTDVRIFRDIYYTGSLAFSPRRAYGVDKAFKLGEDEFFVLGDNSAVSNDSRFWPLSPVVSGDLFLGKPFLVHLPGQAVPLQVFGRSFYWVPDPREIRYIR